MKPERIIVSQTIEHTDQFGRSAWNKIGVEGLVGESEDIQSAIDQAMTEIKIAHERYAIKVEVGLPDRATNGSILDKIKNG